MKARFVAGFVGEEGLHAAIEDEPARLAVALEMATEPGDGPKCISDSRVGW